MNRKVLLAILFVIAVCLIGLRSLITVRFYTSHDGFTHTARIAAYYRSLKDLQIPPRWATNLNGNMGSPIFSYIYPAPYFAGSVLHAFKFSYQDSFRLVMVISTLVSALFMFFWVKENFGFLPAIVGAIYYVWVPYRFLNLYVRAAYAENLAYTFLPLALLCAQKVILSKSRVWFYGLCFSLIAILLSHNEVAAITLPIIFAWLLWWGVVNKSLRRFIVGFLAFLIALVASSWIYIPDFFERKFIYFDRGMSYYSDYFVTWWQLIRSRWGYGFDFPGTAMDDMSLQIGLAQIFVFVISSLILIYGFISFKFRRINKVDFRAIFAIAMIVGLVFMMTDTPYIRTVWKSLPLITTIVDFPWRFLGPISVLTAFLAAFVVSRLRFNKIVAIFLIVVALIANRNHINVNQSLNFTDPVFDSYRGTSTAASAEYTPSWHGSLKFDEKNEPVTVLPGGAKVKVFSQKAQGMDFEIVSTGSAIVRINRFYFPNTVLYHDGKELKIGNGFEVISGKTYEFDDDTGLIKINVTSPGGQYKLRLEDTVTRKLGNVLSCVCLSGLVLGFLLSIKNEK